MEMHVEFDHQQVCLSSDVADIHDYLAANFRRMLVARTTSSAGKIGCFRSREGYTLSTANGVDHYKLALKDLLPLVKDEVRVQFMRARPELLWMHAGAVERKGAALLLAGASGQGKSTLTTLLCQRGWRLLSDDVAPVHMDSDHVYPFPQAPLRRIHPGRELRPDQLGLLVRQMVDLPAERFCFSRQEIRAVVFVGYLGGAESLLNSLGPGEAAMSILRHATNFFDHKGAAVERAARMVGRVSMYQLHYGMAEAACGLLDKLW